jgi:fatty-acyl-CoA synthase
MLDTQNFELCYWKAGHRAHLSGDEFWARVAFYMQFIAAEPRIGQFALIISRSSPDMMALFLAMIASERTPSFFPPNSPLQDQAHYYAQQREAFASIAPDSFLVFDAHAERTLAAIGPEFPARTVVAPPAPPNSSIGGADALAAFRRELLSPRRGPLFLQHSSGTTGIKKAVGITSPALIAQLQMIWPEIERLAGPDVRVASWLPLYHDMGLLAGFLLPLLSGSSVSMIDPFEWIERPASFFEIIQEDRCTVCWMPNFAFRHFIRLRPALPSANLESMRAWVDCSEPCRLVDAAQFESVFQPCGVKSRSVVGCYAMAETVFAVSQLHPEERRALLVPSDIAIGRNVFTAGAQIVTEESAAAPRGHKYVLSSGRALRGLDLAVMVDGKTTPEGLYGEIVVRGPCLFSGYRGRSPQESNLTSDGFFRTGDLGVIVDGHVFVFGRLKEIVIVNGKNLYATDVEHAVNSVRGVKKGRVVAFGLENDQTGSEQLIVVAELEPSAAAAKAKLRSEINRLVSETFSVTPGDVRLVDERWLVKSTSGKISRQDNRLKYTQTFRPA